VYANRHVSPFEGGWGDVKFMNRHVSRSANRHLSPSADRHLSPFEGSPRAGAAEYVQRGGC